MNFYYVKRPQCTETVTFTFLMSVNNYNTYADANLSVMGEVVEKQQISPDIWLSSYSTGSSGKCASLLPCVRVKSKKTRVSLRPEPASTLASPPATLKTFISTLDSSSQRGIRTIYQETFPYTTQCWKWKDHSVQSDDPTESSENPH